MKFLTMAALTVFLWGCGGASEQGAPSAAAGGETAKVGAQTGPSGEETYNNFCASCHNPGLSGAPRLGDVEGWAPRIAKGKALLLETTIAGVQPAMPPRGMCFSCSDEDLAAAIDYMIERSQ